MHTLVTEKEIKAFHEALNCTGCTVANSRKSPHPIKGILASHSELYYNKLKHGRMRQVSCGRSSGPLSGSRTTVAPSIRLPNGIKIHASGLSIQPAARVASDAFSAPRSVVVGSLSRRPEDGAVGKN